MVNDFYWCPLCERCLKDGPSGMCYMCFFIVNCKICKKCEQYNLLNKYELCDLCSIILNKRECPWCKLKKGIGVSGVCKLCLIVKHHRHRRNKIGSRTKHLVKEFMKNYNCDYNNNTEPNDTPSAEIHNLLDYRYDYNIVNKAIINKAIINETSFNKNQNYFKNLFNAIRSGDKQKIKDIVKNIVDDNINIEIHFKSTNSNTYLDSPIEDIITLNVKIVEKNDNKNNCIRSIDIGTCDDELEYWQ